MATIEELKRGLIDAHRRGDVVTAKSLARSIRLIHDGPALIERFTPSGGIPETLRQQFAPIPPVIKEKAPAV